MSLVSRCIGCLFILFFCCFFLCPSLSVMGGRYNRGRAGEERPKTRRINPYLSFRECVQFTTRREWGVISLLDGRISSRGLRTRRAATRRLLSSDARAGGIGCFTISVEATTTLRGEWRRSGRAARASSCRWTSRRRDRSQYRRGNRMMSNGGPLVGWE